MDIGNLRTDVTDNGVDFPMDFAKSNLSMAAPPLKGFPSTGLLNPAMTSIPNFGPGFMEYNSFVPETYPMAYQQSPRSTLREQKWLECHEYFLKWITKLNALVQETCLMEAL